MLDLADLQRGQRLLDLASGRGEPALRAATRVGTEGYVLAVEAVEALSEMTREKVSAAGLTQIELRTQNAELLTDLEPASFQAATCRWGLMYMEAPVTALGHACRALELGGPFVAALWAEPERVPYYTLPRDLLRRYVEVPEPDPDGPNTFRYASVDRIREDFALAGFSIEHVEEAEVPVFEAETPREMLGWVRALGLEDLVSALPEVEQQAWETALLQELERQRPGQALQLGGVTRIIRARKS